MPDTWYISRDGKQREGPFTTAQVRAMLGTGQLRSHMLGWSQGRADWVALGTIEELGVAPPPLPMQTLIDPDKTHGPASADIAPPIQSPVAPQPMAVLPAASHQMDRVPIDARPAGFLLRLVAILIDTLIVGTAGLCAQYAVGFAIGLVVRASDGKISLDEAMPFVFGGSLLASLAVAWIYYAGLESSRRQATLGKLAAGLRVTDMERARLSFRKASGRFFSKLLSGLMLGIGFLMVLWTARKQGLHDILAGTLVLRGAVPLECAER